MSFSKSILFLTTLSFLFTNCSNKAEYKLLQTQKTQKQKVKITARSIEYRILSQDRLNVVLYKSPEQNAAVPLAQLGQTMNTAGILVDTSGYISLPLINKVKVSGLTQTQAAQRITKKYKKYLNTPSVYVEVMNKRLFVLGEVKKPGVIKIDKEKMTLFEALAFAGDFTDAAMRHNIIILSNSHRHGLQMRRVDLTNFDKMKYSSLMLRPNDIIYVQPNSWKEFQVNANDVTSIFKTIGTVIAPFATLKFLSN